MSQATVADNQTGPPFEGARVDMRNDHVVTATNEEAAAEIPFGVMVGQGTADNDVLLLAAVTDQLHGVVVHSHAHSKPTELGDDGLTPDTSFGVMRKGVIWVRVEDDVVPSDPVRVRAVATGAERAGDFLTAADGTDTIIITPFARFLTTALAGELVQVEIDMNQASLAVADT